MAKKNETNDNVLGMLAHLLGLFTWIIGPLVLYLVYKNDKKAKFITENARHSLNFQISVIIYSIICWILMIILIGGLLLIALGIFELVVIILAIVNSLKGEIYKYPLEIEFIK